MSEPQSAKPALGKRPAAAAGGHPRSKGFYKMSSQNKRKKFGGRLHPLCVGVQGVLITTGDKEKICVPEAYNLLNEYADQLYGQEEDNLSDDEMQTHSDPDSHCHGDSGSDAGGGDEGMATAAAICAPSRGGDASGVAVEGGGLRGRRERRFSAMNSGAKHVVFIKCSAEVDPTTLVHTMLSDIHATKITKSRYCQRILPVVKVCHTSLDDIRKCAEDVLAPHFHLNTTDAHTFAVNCKSRNHSTLKREEVIRLVAAVVTKEDMYPHRVDFDAPELVIIVEIIRNVCCLSVVRDFHTLRKYNIQSLTAVDPELTSPKAGSKTMPPAQPPSSAKTTVNNEAGVEKMKSSLSPMTQAGIEISHLSTPEFESKHSSAGVGTGHAHLISSPAAAVVVAAGNKTAAADTKVSPPSNPRTESELVQPGSSPLMEGNRTAT